MAQTLAIVIGIWVAVSIPIAVLVGRTVSAGSRPEPSEPTPRLRELLALD